MLRQIKGLLLLAGFLLTGIARAQEPQREVMLQKIFASLLQEDPAAYIRLFPDAALMRQMMKDMAKRSGQSEAEAREMNELVDSMSDSTLTETFTEDFRKYRSLGADEGVDWKVAALDSIASDSTTMTDEGMSIPMLNGTYYFHCGSKAFFMEFNEVLWLNDKGWYGVTIQRIGRREDQ